MSFETTTSISVSVDGGPPGVTQKSKLKNVIAANSKRVTFSSDPEKKQGPQGTWKLQHRSIVITDTEKLGFFTVSADKFTFKDCGKDKAGIGIIPNRVFPSTTQIAVSDVTGQGEWIESPRVFMKMLGQDIESFKKVTIVLNTEMFDCTKPESEELKVSVSYGLIDNDAKPDPDGLSDLEDDDSLEEPVARRTRKRAAATT